jgi:DnaJ family protein A protein 3
MRVSLGSSEVYVTFRVKTSEKFRRDKEDIHSEVNVSVVQAMLGGAIKVPGIYEDHVLQVRRSYFFIIFLLNKFKIPPGTQSHQRFRLIGKGIKRLQSPGTGDHYVHVKIKIPTYVSFKSPFLL